MSVLRIENGSFAFQDQNAPSIGHSHLSLQPWAAHSMFHIKKSIDDMKRIHTATTALIFALSINKVHPQETLRIGATEWTDQFGTRNENNSLGTTVGFFDSEDYLTYSDINFGSLGFYQSMCFSYAKGNHNGKMEIRIGDTEGTLIGELFPWNTGGWGNFITTCVNIEDVEGAHNLTFVGKDSSGVLNLEWFELTTEGEGDIQWEFIIGT